MSDFEVDRNATFVADTAYMAMTHIAHPKGYIVSPATMLRRAIIAYEWAKNGGLKDVGGGYVEIPSQVETINAVLEYERGEE